MTTVRVLCVDDEPRVLEGLENHLAMHWEVATATSASEGLRILAADPFAVVISDMRMPGIDGAQFLELVRLRSPSTVRILLTGQADLNDAVAAVNEGGVFRMLLKPCPTERLLDTVTAAVRQHQLVIAEKVLLEQTLRASVGVLTDMLGLVHPLAFGCTTRVTAIVRHVVAELAISDGWQIELAAMLSQLGCVTLDHALVEALEAGTATAEQRAAFAQHPAVGASFLARIPRLEGVAAMVASQLQDAPPAGVLLVQRGGELLQLAVQLDRAQRHNSSFAEACARVVERRAWGPELISALRSFHAPIAHVLTAVLARDLRPNMVLEADAVSARGELWMAKGLQLTDVAIKRLRALAERHLLKEPITVRTSG